MAVEIPVVVDIDAAFQEAAAHIPKAIKPMQEYLNSNALRIQVDLGDGRKFSVKQIFEDAKMSAADFEAALANIEVRISEIAAKGGFDLTKGLTTQEANLMRVYGALDAKVNKTADGSKLIGKLYEVNIEKARKKVQQLTTEIERLTAKQNLAYKRGPNGSFIKTQQFDVLSDKIKVANIDLLSANKNLSLLSVELDKITSSGVRAASAMSAIKSPAVQMVEAWEMGSAYVERYNASLATANSKIGMLIKSSLSLMSIHAAVNFVRNIRQVTSEFEMQRVALGGIIQDTEEAERLFKRIKAAAIQSPFEIKDLVSFTKQLSAYRIETENLFDVTMRLADVSAGLGVDMSRLVLAYGQVRAASVLRGQELRQFTEAGIPLVELLAEKFSVLNHRMVSTGEVFELISKRAVPFRMIEEIFNDMTEAGGIFYKMQEKQSETLKGQWMKLKDALSIMYDEIGNTKAVHGAMESLLKDAMSLLQNWREVGRNIKVVVAAMVAYKLAIVNARIAQSALTAVEMAQVSALELNAVGRSKVIASLFGEAAATKTQVALGNLYVSVKTKEMMATNLFTRSLYRMIAAMLANPYALAIAGITALVAILIKYINKSKEAVVSTDQLQKSINSFEKAKTHASDINELCDAYDRLSEKSDKTAAEEERLSRITRDLAKSYPSAISGTNEHTKALILDTKAIRDRNEAVRDAIRLALLGDKEGAEQRVAELQKEYDSISKTLERGTVQKGAYGGTWFEPISEEERATLGKRIIELESELGKYKEAINEAEISLEDFKKELIGPPLPDFFGDEWRMKINRYSTVLSDATTTAKAFTVDQIRGFGSVEDAIDEAIKEYDKLTKSITFYEAAIESATGAERQQLLTQLEDTRAIHAMYGQIISDYNAWNLVHKKTSGSSSYTQDPFIKQMEERMKFMKDFQKGYEDLQKYISSSDALSDVAEKMKARGLSLGINVEDQAQAAKDLSRWYSDAMDDVFEQAKKHGATGTIESFLSQQISDTTNRGKALRDFQKLLQSLFDAKTDLDVSKVKKDLEDELKRVSDEIKRSETARNFFQNILDLTGDEQLAATMGISVYGDIGSEFKDRLQSQLDTALQKLDASDVTDELRSAIASQDFSVIFKYLDKFPEEWQKRLKQMAEDSEKFNADRVQNLLKALQSAKTYGDKRVELAKQTAKRTAEIEEMNISDSDKKNLLTKNMRKEAEEAAKLQYEAFKDTPMYVELFADLDAASSRMLRNMQAQLESMKDNWKDLHPRELKELQSRLSEIDKQLASRNPFKAMSDSIQEYNRLRKTLTRKDAENQSIEADRAMQVEKEMLDVYTQQYEEMKRLYGEEDQRTKSAKISMEIQRDLTDQAIEQAEAAQNTANQYRTVRQHIYDAAEELKKWSGYLDESLSAIGDIVYVFGSDDTSETFKILSDGISKTAGGAASLAAGIATGNPVEIVKGVSSIVTGVAETIQKLRFKKIDKELERQQRLIDELEYSYGRLEKAMEQSFGSEYIYNYTQQLENLVAKQKAYEEQARLEREKGKKADKDKIKDYENAARDAADQISDMRSQLSEFFSGTDLASAAQDFADAWIDAYKEFSSTTDAMGEKFNDMIESMINRSLAAKIMQEMLSPIFSQIDELSKDGLLSTEDIASIAALAQERIPLINDAMTNLMTSLASAGYDVKTQTAGLKGISKDIAGASEESILGLAAAVNTQNFYISYVPVISENVAQILSAMTGGASPTSATATTENGDIIPSVQQMVYDHLPSMDQNMAEMLRLLRSVVTTKNASTNTAYIAVK